MNSDALDALSYGMYILGVKGGNYPCASIVNTVFQVSSDPQIIAVSVNHDNYTNKCIKKEKAFTISIASKNTSGVVIEMLGFTSGRNQDKLTNVAYDLLPDGLPVIREDICGFMRCEVIDSVEMDTHTLFLSIVTNFSKDIVGVPMTYAYYKDVLKGTVPINAPTYVGGRNLKYHCLICGYEYDDDFDGLQDEWVCPICGALKSIFKGEAIR